MAYTFFCNCVSWDLDDVYCAGGLMDLIDDRVAISRRTFLQKVNRDDLSELSEKLSYETHPKRGLTMAGDRHIEYFRSRLHGETVYGFRHSGIEYVFIH